MYLILDNLQIPNKTRQAEKRGAPKMKKWGLSFMHSSLMLEM